MTNRSSLAVAALAAVTLLAAVPVRAQDAVTITRGVPTADLDLTSAVGAATLRHRVRIAAHKVCGGPVLMGDPDHESYVACIEQAEQAALASSNALIASVRTGGNLALNQPSH